MNKFISTAAPATAYQREIIEILIEECAEIQQRATKLLRFGPTEVQPGQPNSNSYRVGLEVGDFLQILDLALEEGLVSREAIEIGRENKKKQLLKYMQTTKGQQ